MIERTRNLDLLDLIEEEFGHETFARISNSTNRSMPVSSHTRAKAGRRRFGKRHSTSDNGAHKRYRRRSLHKRPPV